MLSKSLIQFSVGGQGCVPSVLFTWGQTRVEVMKIMVTFFKRSQAPRPAAGRRRPTPLLETPGHSQASLGQSPVGSLLLSPGSWCTRFCLCLPRVCFPVLWKFWRLYGGVDGDLLQEASATPRSAAPRASAPAAGHCRPEPPQEMLRQLCLSLRGVPGAHKVCLSLLSVSGGYGV